MEKHVEDTVAGGTWIFLGNLTVSLTGFVFWVVVAKLVGAESIGMASMVVSSASIAATLTSASMNLAVIREFAVKEFQVFTSTLLLAVLTGCLASSISLPLIGGLGYSRLAVHTLLLAFLTVISVPLTSSLIGLERFREYFTAVAAGSIAKLSMGVALALLGLGFLAPLIGYIAYLLTASITALAILTTLTSMRLAYPSREDLKSLTVLTLSNYPYMISNQLLTMLSVYIFAYLVREAAPTGILYISMMIALAITAIPNSLLSAALPIGTRRNVDPFSDSLRIGLALATPVVVAVIAAPRTILMLINPELVEGADTLRILMLSIAPLAALTASITKLNKEKNTKMLTVVGVARLTLLIALLVPLTKTLGITGAATAYLAANTLLLPIALKHLPTTAKSVATLWTIHIATTLLSYASLAGEVTTAIALVIVSIAAIHVARIVTVNEILSTLKTAITTLLRKHRERTIA
ncbi:MAG: oligosaccharide flippase family protein [Desulfurococcales archaeon]|nr:oligosaccharide flippase family protein [Desulfurococcales archaeon]